MSTEKADIKKRIDIIMSSLVYVIENKNLREEIAKIVEEDNGKNIPVMNEALKFWTVVEYDSNRVTLLDLARIYDEDKDSCGLKKLINCCESNQVFFSEKYTLYGEELRGVKCSNDRGEYTFQEILKSLNYTYERVDKQRRKIKTLRDRTLAHIDKRSMNGLKELYGKNELQNSDIDKLIDAVSYICNLIAGCLYKGVYIPRINEYGGATQLVELLRLGYQAKHKK